jgi:hypothetical protein
MIQHYVIKFVSVSDLQQVGGFLRVLWFPPPIKQTATIIFLPKIKRKTAIRGKISSPRSESPSFSDAVIQG